MTETNRGPNGYGKRLDIDLSTGKIIKTHIDPKFAREYIGGMGFSCKILYDEVGPDVDPFSPDNLVIIGNGTLTGTNALCAGRTEITTKHPLTGHLGTGNTGGSWGIALKRAGFDLVIIRGKAENPVYLWIDDDKCELRDASHLWGKNTYEASSILEQDLNPSAPSQVKTLIIGPAGENLVRYACTINDYYHCAARNGAGAVMGSKKLKAIAVCGTGAIKPARPREFQKAVREARQRFNEYDKLINSYWGMERAEYVNTLGDSGTHGGRNFQTAVTPHWARIRGLASTGKYMTGASSACHACPAPCHRIAEVKEGKYAGVKVSRFGHGGVIHDFGAKCAIDNLPAIWKCKQLCHQLGMDYATVAGVVAFAMELFQRAIITEKDTDGLELSWGNEDVVIQILHKIAFREGCGNLLAEGSMRMARKIGKEAEKYVMATKGMEMMAMDPRSAHRGRCFGELTNPRGGDNLKSSHVAPDQYEPLWWVDKFDMFEDVKKKAYCVPPEKTSSTWEGKPAMVKWLEDLYSMANALGICIFPVARSVMGPTHLSRLFSSFTGWETTPQDITKLGERVFTLLKAYTTRQGLSRKDDRYPDRFYTEQLSDGHRKGTVLSMEETDKVLDEYYELRDWDKSTGLPTEEKLIDLGLGEIAKELVRLGKLPG
ncbi:aldehyde ferredoxin oxidoreductase family protein [Chloroflexota bacterium]